MAPPARIAALAAAVATSETMEIELAGDGPALCAEFVRVPAGFQPPAQSYGLQPKDRSGTVRRWTASPALHMPALHMNAFVRRARIACESLLGAGRGRAALLRATGEYRNETLELDACP